MGRGAAPLFRETQAVMSLLEGFSDYVMDEVGGDLVPDVERISARFHERRDQADRRSSGPMLRLTGMDLKMEQYRKGERFVRGDRRAPRGAGGPAPAVGRPRDAADGRRDRRARALDRRRVLDRLTAADA